jgi:hypothetical protein
MAGTHAEQDAPSPGPEFEDLDWLPQPRPRTKRRRGRVLWVVIVVVAVVAAGTGLAWVRHARTSGAPAPPGIAAGLHWSRVVTIPPVAPTAILAGGPGFVAGSATSGTPLWTSPDGANWTQVPVTDQRLASFHPQVLTLSGGRIYAAGQQDGSSGGGSDPRVRFGVWSSPDGQNWSQSVTPPATGPTAGSAELVVTGLTGGPKGLVAVGYLADADRSQPLAWYSADGRAWDAAELAADTPTANPKGKAQPEPKAGPGRRLDGVIAIPGGFLAIEGPVKTTDALHTGPEFVAAAQAGPPGLLVSADGQQWRPTQVPSAPMPGGGTRTLVPGLLKLDAGRVLAIGVDPEAREVVDRSLGEPRRVVVDRARPVVWRLRLAKGWYRLSQPLAQTQAEVGLAQPAQASVRALANLNGKLVAVGDVTHGDATDPADPALWTSTDGGVTWSDAVSGAQFTGAGAGSLTTLAVGGGGSIVVAIGTNSLGTPELWRAVPVASG